MRDYKHNSITSFKNILNLTLLNTIDPYLDEGAANDEKCVRHIKGGARRRSAHSIFRQRAKGSI